MPTGTAYLEGGPCDGTTHKITAAESDSGQIVCKGGLYKNPMQGQLHNGDLVFKYAGKAPPPGGGSPDPLKAPRAHKGWAHMRLSVNHHLPVALHNAERQTRAALRSLHRAHKVKG